MRIGLDFHETITSHPKHFRDLVETILKGGGEVYIITAVELQNSKEILKLIKQCGIKYTDIDVITFTDYDKVPQLKLAKAKERKIDFMIDDRLDTCQLMTNRGITGLGVAQRGTHGNIVSSIEERKGRGVGSLPSRIENNDVW